MAELAPPDRADIDFVLAHLRQADVDEVAAASGRHPVHALHGVEDEEDTRVGKVNGVPVAVIGVSPGSLLGGGGTIWMLGTDGILENKVAVLRHSKRWVMKMLQKYGTLSNYVDARNEVSIRWLKWLGFTLEDAAPYGVSRLPFHRFHMGENNV